MRAAAAFTRMHSVIRVNVLDATFCQANDVKGNNRYNHGMVAEMRKC